jgi:hypothetical protein
LISVFVVLTVPFISLSLAIAAENFTDKYAGKAQYERDVTLRGHTKVEMTLFKKESDTYVEKSSGEKSTKRASPRGINTSPSEPK